MRSLAFAAAAVLAVALAGCSGSAAETTQAPPAPAASADALQGSITVFAAASLTATFTDLAARFEEQNPGTSVELTFAGSADLVTQLVEGAPADVFASADETNMAKLTDAGFMRGGSVAFATNVLEIAVPPGNPAGIATFADLAAPGLKVVVCAPQVPCGAAAERIEQATGVSLPPVSEESSVTDVLGKVVSGEADAGLVYVTDIRAAGETVEGIAVPEATDAANTYPIAALTDAGNPRLAEAFVEFITGPAGRSVLAAAGFGAP